MSSPQGYGIPRLQELRFLLQAARVAAHGGTYEAVRLSLLKTISQRAVEDIPAGNSARHRLAEDRPGLYVDNATASLAELMHLGFMEKAPLLLSRKQPGRTPGHSFSSPMMVSRGSRC